MKSASTFLAAGGPQERSVRKIGAFLLVWIAMAAPLAWAAWTAGAFAAALVERALIAETLSLKTLLRYRYEGSEAQWSPDLGKVTAELPHVFLMAALLASLLVAARLIYRRPMRSWLTTAAKFRWRLLLVGLTVVGVLQALGVVAMGALSIDGYKPDALWSSRPELIAVTLMGLTLGYLIRGGFEEVLCRGWLLQQTGAYTRNVLVVVAVTSVVFMLLHREWGWFRTFHLLIAGAVFAWAALRTEGLELPTGAHAAWNTALVLLGDDNTRSIRKVDEYGEYILSTPLETTTGELILLLVLPLGVVAAAELAVRWGPLSRWARLGVERRVPA